MPEVAIALKRDADGRYPVLRDGVVVGQVGRVNSHKWHAYLAGDEEPIWEHGYQNRDQAYLGLCRALTRGGNRIVKLQPAPRIDNIVGGHELTQLPYPLHVRCFDGKVLEPWAKRVIGFTRDLARQEVDVYWTDAVTNMDPSDVVGMYVVIQNPGGGYATLDTAVRDVEVSL